MTDNITRGPANVLEKNNPTVSSPKSLLELGKKGKENGRFLSSSLKYFLL